MIYWQRRSPRPADELYLIGDLVPTAQHATAVSSLRLVIDMSDDDISAHYLNMSSQDRCCFQGLGGEGSGCPDSSWHLGDRVRVGTTGAQAKVEVHPCRTDERTVALMKETWYQ